LFTMSPKMLILSPLQDGLPAQAHSAHGLNTGCESGE
jgi:hypothetical protein